MHGHKQPTAKTESWDKPDSRGVEGTKASDGYGAEYSHSCKKRSATIDIHVVGQYSDRVRSPFVRSCSSYQCRTESSSLSSWMLKYYKVQQASIGSNTAHIQFEILQAMLYLEAPL